MTQVLTGGEQLLRCCLSQLFCFPNLEGQPSVALTMRNTCRNHLVPLLMQKGSLPLPTKKRRLSESWSEGGGRGGNQGRGGGGEGRRATLGEARERGGSSSFLPRSWDRIKFSRTDCECFVLLSQEA